MKGRSRADLAATVVLGVLVVYGAFRFVRWAVVGAVWALPAGAGSSLCRSVQGEGACWAVIHERVRFILFGPYPTAEHWRPAVVCLLFVLLYGAVAWRGAKALWILIAALVVSGVAALLMRGGFLGLPVVPSDRWGGLPLTFLLSTAGFAAATPLGVALAFGRRSRMPAIRALSTVYIELIRGVPIITFLFMAAVLFPLFVPDTFSMDKLLRAQIALVLVIAAYLAEVLRGGLQAIPIGQYEAAAAIGLPFWPAMILVVLPQAFRATIPALVNTYIALFKDTSLVAVIGLFDLLGSGKAVIVDAKWVGFGVEVYLFTALIYFAFCYSVSRYSQRLERTLALADRA